MKEKIKKYRTQFIPPSFANWLLLLLMQLPLNAEPLQIPYLTHNVIVDGNLAEWAGKAHLNFCAPDIPKPEQNCASVITAWDQRNLYFAIQVQDNEVFKAPEDLSIHQYYQFDSVHVYLDANHDLSPKMDHNDFNFLILADGRFTVFQGDEFLKEIAQFGVPQKQALLSSVVASQIQVDGYSIELKIPFSLLGLPEPKSGIQLAVDIAWNDWLASHSPYPEIQYGANDLRALLDKQLEFAVPGDTQQLQKREAGLANYYRPWSYSQKNDFGYPADWQSMVLQGSPNWLQASAKKIGLERLWALSISSIALVIAIILFVVRYYHLRHIERLTERIRQLKKPASSQIPLNAEQQKESEDAKNTQTDDLLERAVAMINHHIDEPISSAQLADLLSMNLRTLQRRLVAFDTTPKELILTVKMNRAKEMLQTGNCQIKQVALDVGFSDPYHFSKRFRAYFQQPPSRFIPQG